MDIRPPIPSPFPEPEPFTFKSSFVPVFIAAYAIGATGILILVGPISHLTELLGSRFAGAVTGVIGVAFTINVFKVVVTK